MYIVVIVYCVALFFLVASYIYTKKHLTDCKKTIYGQFELYFSHLHNFFLDNKDSFYREDKWSQVVFDNKKKFLWEKEYSILILRNYAKKFTQDSNYLHSLFPTYTSFPELLPNTASYIQWISYEKSFKLIHTLLSVITFWFWSLLMSE